MRYNPVEAVRVAGPKLRQAIALAGDEVDFEDVLADVRSGRMQVFTAGTSILLTQVQVYPRGKTLQLCYGAGALHEMEPWMDAVFEWGRQQGCTKVIMVGRRGWERTFLHRRLTRTQYLMEGTL